MSNSELLVTKPTVKRAPAAGITSERFRTIIQDAHINFLIGAGTSSAYFGVLGDVESVLTELGSVADDRDNVALARASVQGYFFENAILPNLGLMSRDSTSHGLLKSYGRFLSTINQVLLRRRSTLLGKQANIFTTNVDMAFEVTSDLLELEINDGFTGMLKPRLDLGTFGTIRVRQGTTFEFRSEIPVINLMKLHGSVAWSHAGGQVYFDFGLTHLERVRTDFDLAKDALIPLPDSRSVQTAQLLAQSKEKNLDAVGHRFAQSYQSLGIVNPEKTKFAATVLHKTHYELLRRFANELEKENSALIVHGFSFRDEHLRDLILRAARTNPTLIVIIFCYSRSARDTIQQLIPDEQIANGNVLFVAPSSPDSGEDERRISIDVLVDDYLAPLLTDRQKDADVLIEVKLNEALGDADES